MSIDKHVSLLFQNVDVFSFHTRSMNILCIILFILGVIGNGLGIIIFSSSRRTWRISSVYACLATCSSITNLLCVIQYASILHSTSRHILSELVGQTEWACKIYQFSSSFRFISSWITLFWMFERLIYVSTKLQAFSNRWCSFKLNFTIPIIIVIIILGCVIGPPVYMYQPKIISNNHGPMNSTIKIMYCELHPNASIQWQKYFYEVHLGMNYFTISCLFSELIPTGMIIFLNSYIIYHVRIYRRLYQSKYHNRFKKQSRIKSWMNIVLIFHSSLFLLSLFVHIIGHFVVILAHETWWVLLAVLMNYSLNFYIYCLSGKAFRNEVYRFIERLKTRLWNGSQIHREQSCWNQRLNYEMRDFQGIIQL